MSEEKKPDGVIHIYDGIEEQDNQLPRWWMGILFGTILFAFGYWGYYEVAKAAPGPRGAWLEQVTELKKQQEANRPKTDDDTLLALAKDPAVVKEGEQVFQTTCAACHGMQAQGVIGPNLTDNFWLHGGKPSEIQHTIATGFLDKGMPAWEPTLGANRVRNVAAWVIAQRGKNVPGKAPQGEPVQ